MKTTKEQVKAAMVELGKELEGKSQAVVKARLLKLSKQEMNVWNELVLIARTTEALSKETIKDIKNSQKRSDYRKEIALRDKVLQKELALRIKDEMGCKTVLDCNNVAKAVKAVTGTKRNQAGMLKRACGFKPVKNDQTGTVTWEKMTAGEKKDYAKPVEQDWKHKLQAFGF